MENTVNSDEVVNNDLKNNLKDVLNEIATYLFNSLQVYQTNVPINFQFINPIFEQFVLKKQQQIKDINNNMLENKREHEAIEREIKKPKLDVMKKINHSKKVIKEFKEFLNQIGNKQSTTL
ncbi:hypothetical protein K502DRAFT_103678 [Neoconidiobolus thromboides FSU 785]|nr:hypothetical protein K502DRAFT_103678 [Neoconidiobolus thromboides FSU 785]